jgi:chromosome segregation ATPase
VLLGTDISDQQDYLFEDYEVPPKDDVLKVERSLREAEARLANNKVKIEIITRELESMQILQIQLEENLKNLKQRGIVALVMEYRKARGDLVKTKIKISQLEWDIALAENVYRDAAKNVEGIQLLFEKLFAEVGKNVLQGKWPKK